MNVIDLGADLTQCFCSPQAHFWGFSGAGFALIFTSIGSAIGIAKCGLAQLFSISVGVGAIGVVYPEKAVKSLIPSIMASIVAIYGLIIAVIIGSSVTADDFTRYKGYRFMGAGLAVGLSGISSGWAIGVVGESGVVSVGHEQRVFVGMILLLIFGEALGLFGFIVGLLLGSSKDSGDCRPYVNGEIGVCN